MTAPRRAADPPPHPLRLLLVADSLDVGGAERHIVALATALVRAGHAVTIACSVDGALSASARQAGIALRPLGHRLVKRRLSVGYAWRLARLVRGGHFDLVHAHMYASAVAATLATLGTGLPLVLTEHSEASWRGRLARWCSRIAYRRAARIIAVSEPIRQRLIEQDGAPAARVTVIPNALPLPEDASAPTPAPAGLPEPPLVGVVARLQPEKGLTTFVEAAAMVGAQLPAAQFLVVGDGPMRQELPRLAERLGVRERLHFLGFRPDAPAVMQRLSVLVVPSLSEGTPLVTLEGMAAGVPVVASAVGGIPDQIRHGREGLLVPPADSVALAQAIARVLREPERARALARAGRRRVAARYDHATLLRRTEAVYRAARGRGERWAPSPPTPVGPAAR